MQDRSLECKNCKCIKCICFLFVEAFDKNISPWQNFDSYNVNIFVHIFCAARTSLVWWISRAGPQPICSCITTSAGSCAPVTWNPFRDFCCGTYGDVFSMPESAAMPSWQRWMMLSSGCHKFGNLSTVSWKHTADLTSLLVSSFFVLFGIIFTSRRYVSTVYCYGPVSISLSSVCHKPVLYQTACT